jgi:hypothetical protein
MVSQKSPSTGSGRTDIISLYDLPFVLNLSKHPLKQILPFANPLFLGGKKSEKPL